MLQAAVGRRGITARSSYRGAVWRRNDGRATTASDKLKVIGGLRCRSLRFQDCPEFKDDMEVFVAAITTCAAAYKWASRRLQDDVHMACLALVHHRRAFDDIPPHFRFCPDVRAAHFVEDDSCREKLLRGLPSKQRALNQIEACKTLNACLGTASIVKAACSQPLVATDISGDTWKLEPAIWTGAAGAGGIVNAFATHHTIKVPFEVMVENPSGNFVLATAPMLMTGTPEAMIIYS